MIDFCIVRSSYRALGQPAKVGRGEVVLIPTIITIPIHVQFALQYRISKYDTSRQTIYILNLYRHQTVISGKEGLLVIIYK